MINAHPLLWQNGQKAQLYNLKTPYQRHLAVILRTGKQHPAIYLGHFFTKFSYLNALRHLINKIHPLTSLLFAHTRYLLIIIILNDHAQRSHT